MADMVSWPNFLYSSTSMSKDNITSTFGLQLRSDQRKTFFMTGLVLGVTKGLN